MFANCILILTLLAVVQSAKILVVVPSPSISHQVPFRPLILELINRNHEVTVIMTDPVYPPGKSPDNLSEFNLHNLSYTIWVETGNELTKRNINNLTKMRLVYSTGSKIFIEQLKDESVVKLITDTTMKFDLLIVENCVPATLILFHIFKAPVIFMSPFGALPGNMNMIGSVTHPLLYPTHYHKKIYNLTIWEKMGEIYTDIKFNKVHEEHELDEDRMLKDLFGTLTPTVNELKNNVHMLFLNVHPLMLHNQPVPLNVVYTWGINEPMERKLPTDLQSYLDSSKHGVIYFSFGSLFKTSEFSPRILKIFVEVFSQLPYNILWKWDSDELPAKLENIKTSKWFPQTDVLRHPNVKLFITHGGLQSTNDAIRAGVPLIGIPQFSDQEYNTEKYLYFKIGIKLDYNSLTLENFDKAIKTVLTNYNSYKHNIITLRTQMYDQPKPPLEHVTWWIEYVLRHGGVRHLRAPSANMSWVEYYELELVLLVLIGLIITGIVLLLTMYTCLLTMLRLLNLKSIFRKVSACKY